MQKTHKLAQTKSKSTGPSISVRTVYLCVLKTVYNCYKQHSTEKFW